MVGGHESVVYFDITLNPARYIDNVRLNISAKSSVIFSCSTH